MAEEPEVEGHENEVSDLDPSRGRPGELGQPGSFPGGGHGGTGGRGGDAGKTGEPGQIGATGARGPGLKQWHINTALAAILISLVGGSISLGKSAGSIEDKLDRNCRILNTIQADVRFVIVQSSERHTKQIGGSRPDLADQFRQIFQSAGQEGC